MKHYETIGGQVTRGETFAKLTELLREAEECCYVLAHLQATEDGYKDKFLVHGWRGIGQMQAMIRAKVVELGKGSIQ